MLLCVFAVIACRGGETAPARDGGDTISFRYSRLLTAIRYADHVLVQVADPWHKGKILHQYALVTDSAGVAGLPLDATVVKVPLRRCVPLSTVHASLMVSLGVGEFVAGVADMQYVKVPYIRDRYRSGTVADVGSSMSPDIERIVSLTPDAIFASPFDNSGGYGSLEEMGVPVIECADYMETSALGRAEWIRFYGMLFGKERLADSLFAAIDSSYNSIKAKAAMANNGKSLVMDKMTGSVWYMPGGRSTIGTIIADANAGYAFSDTDVSGSLSLSFETVLSKSGDADFWLLRYSGKTPASYSDLVSENRGYGEMRAFKLRQCYGCNVEKSLFYEETPFRPDWLLADFVRIVHPEVLPAWRMRYFHPLADGN